jgi:tRNA1Val (adenine37-N6)-methyltransferase
MIRCRKNAIGVEFGTGTGIIPLLLSIHKEFQKIYALEIQPEYAALAKENIEMNGFENRVEVICGDLKEASRLVPHPCDFVFTNPPYMKKNSGETASNPLRAMARHEISCDLTDICRSASGLLQDKGEFYCVYRTNRLPELFCAMKEFSLEPKNMVLVTPMPHSAPELVLVRGVKNAAPDCKTRPPFVLQNEKGERSPEAALLYQTGHLDFTGGL